MGLTQEHGSSPARVPIKYLKAAVTRTDEPNRDAFTAQICPGGEGIASWPSHALHFCVRSCH